MKGKPMLRIFLASAAVTAMLGTTMMAGAQPTLPNQDRNTAVVPQTETREVESSESPEVIVIEPEDVEEVDPPEGDTPEGDTPEVNVEVIEPEDVEEVDPPEGDTLEVMDEEAFDECGFWEWLFGGFWTGCGPEA